MCDSPWKSPHHTWFVCVCVSVCVVSVQARCFSTILGKSLVSSHAPWFASSPDVCVLSYQLAESNRAEERQRRALIDKMLRVDHAGEYAAVRIYEGQLAVLKNDPSAPIIEARPAFFIRSFTYSLTHSSALYRP